MDALMRAEGLPYGVRSHTYNSRLAQELAKWAETKPGGKAVHAALYRAYFVHGHNIGDIEVLVEVARSLGWMPEEARKVLVGRQFRAAVDADWEASARAGVTAVPTFSVGDRRVVGAQSYQMLEQLVASSGRDASTAGSEDDG